MTKRGSTSHFLAAAVCAGTVSLVPQVSAQGQEITAKRQSTGAVQALPESAAVSPVVWLTEIGDVFDAYAASALDGLRISVRDVQVEDAEGGRFWIVSADQKARIRVIAAERGS